MSAQAAARADVRTAGARASAQPARPLPSRQDAPPRLRLVRAPQQARTRVPFVLMCMGVLGAALLSALLLNTSMAHGAYEKYEKSNELGQLQQDEKDLVAALDQKSSPAHLAEAARALGMVPAGGTGWLRLSDGSVQGAPSAGAAG
ncbi:hypothetical protein [Cellulomonas soli]|uniref:Cell division protein FtsL n=1 Tax=Cellulomonas soli TaxID=931535 RepID=A0A512PBQ9_9CELL|nr:hypothetical protein [Cellulomonas soli]NYI60967.1 hypothetical protein [Cellulomonas soli]GEP68618.1 hypothetical protein CSO01_13330 [Cellulomonas soli]